MSGMQVRVELRIDELIVEGFDSFDGERFSRAVEQQFSRLLAERGIPSGLTRNQTTDQIESGPVELAASAGLNVLAANLARALYAGLDR